MRHLIRPDSLYLVTGGAGFIGSHLVEHLVAGGARVRVLDDFSTGKRENLEPVRDRIELVEGSVVDEAACREAAAGADYVLHQAALPSVARSVDDPVRTHEVCATGTLRMLQAARDAKARRFVCAGSSSAYGDTPTLPKHEGMPTAPRSPYAVAKLTGEHYARAFHPVYGLETVTLRYFNVFGPRQDPTSPYTGVIALFLAAGLDGEAPEIHGDGEQTRDFTYVENVVQANLRACTASGPNVPGAVFNVGCGDRLSIKGLWEEIRALTGSSGEARYGPSRAGDVRDSLASLDRITDTLGYEPRVSLREGLRRTLVWLQERR